MFCSLLKKVNDPRLGMEEKRFTADARLAQKRNWEEIEKEVENEMKDEKLDGGAGLDFEQFAKRMKQKKEERETLKRLQTDMKEKRTKPSDWEELANRIKTSMEIQDTSLPSCGPALLNDGDDDMYFPRESSLPQCPQTDLCRDGRLHTPCIARRTSAH